MTGLPPRHAGRAKIAQYKKTKVPVKSPDPLKTEEKTMKKLIAALMSLCLIFCAAAFAANTDPHKINWSDYEAQAANVEGQFANVAQTGLKMFVPAEFKDTDIPEEALQGGTFMVLKSGREEKAVINAQILSIDIDTFKAGMESQGKEAWQVEVNGLIGYQFMIEAEGVSTACLAIGTEKGTVLTFNFTLVDQEPYTGLYKVMAASIPRAE